MSQPQIQYVPVYVSRPSSNGIAVAGLVLGIIAAALGFLARWGLALLLLAGVPGLLAIIFGIVGLVIAARIGGRRRAAAVWAIVLGVTPLVFTWLAGFIFG